MIAKLKPCPLCGRKPVISQDEDRGGIGGPVLTDWVIECRCGLTLSAAKRETATRRWNRRNK